MQRRMWFGYLDEAPEASKASQPSLEVKAPNQESKVQAPGPSSSIPSASPLLCDFPFRLLGFYISLGASS